MSVLLTTNPGIEESVVSELQDHGTFTTQVRPYGFAGHVFVHEHIPDICQRLRSIHHILVPIYRFPFIAMDDLLETLQGVQIDALHDARTFRVTCNRSGTHDFTSMDVQREAGAVIQKRYGLCVDLKGFDVEVRIDIHGERCFVSTQETRKALSSRYTRIYEPRAGLKTNVAYAMIRLAQPQYALLDPFCGSGTILLEAAGAYPGLALYGSDVNEDAVEGTRVNAEANGVSITVRHVDARDLLSAYSYGFDAIATNPPYGIRLGKRLDFYRLYNRFLRQAYDLLVPGGRLVILVFKRKPFRDALKNTRFIITYNKVIEVGEVYPRLYALHKGE